MDKKIFNQRLDATLAAAAAEQSDVTAETLESASGLLPDASSDEDFDIDDDVDLASQTLRDFMLEKERSRASTAVSFQQPSGSSRASEGSSAVHRVDWARF